MQGGLNNVEDGKRIRIPCSSEKAAQRLGVIFLEEGWCVHIGKEPNKNGTRSKFFIEIWKEN